MTTANLYTQLGDPNSPAVRDALTRECEICDAPKDQYCTSIINGQPLCGRIVHFGRFELAL